MGETRARGRVTPALSSAGRIQSKSLDPKSQSTKGDAMDTVRTFFAVVVGVAFAVFAIFLVTNADTENSSEWERWVYVFGAVEAIAFAAVGWMFGKEVNRERAEAAEETANEAQENEKKERAKGSTLAGMVAAGASAAGGGERLEQQGGTAAGGLSQAVEYARKEYGV